MSEDGRNSSDVYQEYSEFYDLYVGADQDPVERLTATYLWILRNAGERLAYALTTLAKGDSLPAVVHCSAGKDRTGVLSALVLGILGVS